MSTPIVPLYLSEDNLIEWDALTDAADGTFVNDATMTFTIKDTAEAALTGANGVSMSYVAASDGKYQGVAPSTVTYTDAATYYLEVTAASSGRDGFRRITCKAQYHGAKP